MEQKKSIVITGAVYWHSIWIRKANKNEKVDWHKMLNDKKYREGNKK